MNKGIRISIGCLLLSQLLLAVFCEEVDDGPILIANRTSVQLDQGPDFAIDGAITITARVSSMVFDETAGDSIPNPEALIRERIGIYRLSNSENSGLNPTNAIGALEDFDIAPSIGSVSEDTNCTSTDFVASTATSENGSFFEYQIALVPKTPGDFALVWDLPIDLQNTDQNLAVIAPYAINDNAFALSPNRCGISFSILDVRERRSEFFFRVVE